MTVYCIPKKCKRFKLLLNDFSAVNASHINVDVYSTSLHYNHINPVASQLKGLEHKMIGNTMVHIKPLKRRQDDVMSLDDLSIKKMNLDKVKSDCVYRQLRSEQLAKNDRSKNDLDDLIKMRLDHPEYLYAVGVPFFVYIFSKEQNVLLGHYLEPVLHLDATGCIIRKVSDQDKRVYYYAGVIQIPSTNRVCAVFEMETSSLDARSIANLLFSYKTYCLSEKCE